jgi:sugar O-acyltransferase (sialic acid O-acetyltransferase NeuD family)
MPRKLLVYGAGGHGREMVWLARELPEQYEPVGFVDDAPRVAELAGLPVLTLAEAAEQFPGAHIVSGIGDSAVREATMEKARNAGLAAATLVHPGVVRSDSVCIGEGTIVAAGSVLSVDITVGRHVQINLGCTINHDCFIEDFATLSPGVRLAGNVRIERHAFLGIGAVVINGQPGEPLVIGAGAFVAAGACVTRSIAPGQKVRGVPAKPW